MNYFEQQVRVAKLNQGGWAGPREITVSPGIAANAGLNEGDIISLGSDGKPAICTWDNGRAFRVDPAQLFRVTLAA